MLLEGPGLGALFTDRAADAIDPGDVVAAIELGEEQQGPTPLHAARACQVGRSGSVTKGRVRRRISRTLAPGTAAHACSAVSTVTPRLRAVAIPVRMVAGLELTALPRRSKPGDLPSSDDMPDCPRAGHGEQARSGSERDQRDHDGAGEGVELSLRFLPSSGWPG